MWQIHSELLDNSRGLKIGIHLDARSAAYLEILRLWQHDAKFRTFFVRTLADTPFSAFRWETPPITIATANRPFEFVLLDSPGLAQEPDVDAFAEHFQRAKPEWDVVSFPNLGGDAMLVVPCPKGPKSFYGHLAAFLRNAPESQKDSFWKMVGDTMQHQISEKPVWLSTAGAGVSWLHARLDRMPKYYGYGPYRDSPKLTGQ